MKRTIAQVLVASVGVLTTSSIVLVACVVAILITLKK